MVVQEFLSGETLKDRLLRNASGLDVDEALRIADEALAGLIYVSRCKIVHRDVKPGNLFLCTNEDGTPGPMKLIDFEIARQSGGTATASIGNIRGTFDYMAPDFTNPEFRGDARSDIFSMGVVLHEMLVGKTPYRRLDGDEKQANFAFLARWTSATTGESPIKISPKVRRLLVHADEVLSKALAQDREFAIRTLRHSGKALVPCASGR